MIEPTWEPHLDGGFVARARVKNDEGTETRSVWFSSLEREQILVGELTDKTRDNWEWVCFQHNGVTR